MQLTLILGARKDENQIDNCINAPFDDEYAAELLTLVFL